MYDDIEFSLEIAWLIHCKGVEINYFRGNVMRCGLDCIVKNSGARVLLIEQ